MNRADPSPATKDASGDRPSWRYGELALFFRAILSRARLVANYLGELLRNGAPLRTGDPACGTVVLLDGVAGLLIVPTLMRVALREAGSPLATYLFDWHRGPRGEMLADLMCRRRNQMQALRLARLLRRLRRENPEAPLHLVAHSGGTGIAVFAAEKLGRTRLDTLVLGAPAVSPDYDFTAALRHVERCYVFTSRRDRFMLGLGTLVFGTMDRRHTASGGMRGFTWQPPRDASATDRPVGTFEQIPWTPAMSDHGHCGDHTGSANVPFLRRYVVPLLAAEGSPSLTVGRSVVPFMAERH